MAYYGNEPAKVALKVGSGVITAEEIQDASISTADIANDAITPNQLDDDGTGFQIGTLGIGAAVSGGHALLVSGSSSISGALTAGSISTGTNGHIDVGDNKAFRAGNGGDLRLMHTGSNSYILNNEGHLILKIDDANENKDIKFELDDGAHTHVMSYDGSTTFAGHIAGTTATFSSDISTSGLITTSIGDSIFGGGEADSRIYITNRGGSSGDDSHFIRGDSQRLSLNAGGSNGEVSLEVNGGQELKILDGSATFSGMTAIGGALDTGSGGTGQLQVVGGQGSQNTLLKFNSASSNEKVRIFLTDATNWSTSIGADTDGDFVVWANGTPSTAGNDRFHVERGGRIGIGNGSPKSHFDFHGKGGISLNSSDVALTNHIYFNDSGDPKKSSASAGSAFYLTGGMCQMYYNSTGSVDAAAGWNLGYKLATDGQSTFYGAITGTSATFSGNVTCASLNVDGAVDFDFGGTSHLNFGNDSGGVHMYVGTDQFFRILGDSGNDEWIRILDGGNVGIGTTSPSSVCTQSKVEIKGLPAFLGLHCDGSDPNGSSGIEFGDSSDGNIGQIHYYHGDNSMNFTTNAGVALSLKNDQSATFAGNLSLASNKAIYFGDTGEYIYGSGTHMYIASSGQIYLTAEGLNWTHTVGSNALSITKSGNGNAINLTHTGTQNIIHIDNNSESGNASVYVENTGSRGYAYYAYSNQGSNQGDPLVEFNSANAAFDRPTLKLQQRGTVEALEIIAGSTSNSIKAALTLKKEKTDGVGGDDAGVAIDFLGENADGGTYQNTSRIAGYVKNAIGGSQFEGGLKFYTVTDGYTFRQALDLKEDLSATFAGNIDMADSKELRIGNSDDLRLYHDGSNSYIDSYNTGELMIRNRRNSGDIMIKTRDSAGNESHAMTFNSDGHTNCIHQFTVGDRAGNEYLYLDSGNTSSGYIRWRDASGDTRCTIQCDMQGDNNSYGDMNFYTGGDVLALGLSRDQDAEFKGKIQNNVSSTSAIVEFRNGNSSPVILDLVMSGAEPNNTTQWFIQGRDAGADEFKIYSDGSFSQMSDISVKENITDVDSMIDKINDLRVVNYNRKNDEEKKPHIGVVAQEIESVFPHLISKNDDDTLMVYKIGLVMPLIKAVQELSAKVTALENA